ncbi:MAG: ABC transporter ATP-binding protein [Rhodobacteraceae bacterium]|nr:ABC transporter ATP-binding protein [Paracoccaceae bacterium]
MTLLDVRDMTIRIGTQNGILRAVHGLDLSLKSGEVLGIVGESGCGKSITALGILDLLPKSAIRTARQILFDGKELSTFSAAAMRTVLGNDIGMIFQDPMTALNPTYTIGNQLVEVYRRHRGGRRSEAEERAIWLLNRVGISAARSRLGQYPHQLSGGLRQRVVIAQALMCEPKLIIADEPTTALDVTVQAQILRLIKDIQEDINAGVIIITHDLGVVAQMADRVLIMYAGEMVETGTTERVFTAPRHPYTHGLLACLPQPEMSGQLGQIRGIVPSLLGDPVGCTFRTRCLKAVNACRMEIPLHAPTHDHRWRCVLPTGLAS